jgi:hypothetical protein
MEQCELPLCDSVWSLFKNGLYSHMPMQRLRLWALRISQLIAAGSGKPPSPGEKDKIWKKSADTTGSTRRVHPLVPLHSCPLNPIKWSARRAADRRPLCLPLPSPLQVALSSVGGRGAPAAPGRGDELEQSQDAIRIERLQRREV